MSALGRRFRPAAMLAALLLVTACGGGGGDGGDTAPSGETGSDGSAFPVTIEHALGETTIAAEPARVVALSWEEDELSQVGVTPVGHWENYYEPGALYPWQEGEVDLGDSTVVGSGTEINLEKIASLDPDLILATRSPAVEDNYEQLSAIAPTVAFKTDGVEPTWQENAELVGAAVGRADEMADAIAGVEEYIDETAAEYPELDGKTFASLYRPDPDTLVVNIDPDGGTAKLMSAFGMTLDPAVVAEASKGSAGSTRVPLSPERLDLLQDVDLLGIGFGSAEVRDEMYDNPLFANLPAVEDGRVHEPDNLGATAANHPGLLNVPWQLDQLRTAFGAVTADVPAERDTP